MRTTILIDLDDAELRKLSLSAEDILDRSLDVLGRYYDSLGLYYDMGYNPEHIAKGGIC